MKSNKITNFKNNNNINNSIIPVFFFLIIIFYIFYSIHNSFKKNNIVFIGKKMTSRELVEKFNNSSYYFNNNRIPKIIIHTWKSNIIPFKYKSYLLSCREHNSSKEYEYKFYSDEDIDDFLGEFYPEWYITYNKLPVKIQRIDFFRYIAVYHFGGFYLDLDMTVYRNFDDLLEYKCVFPIDKRIKCNYTYTNNRFTKLCGKNPLLNIILGQYAFGACKNNQFIKFLIDNIHNNIDYIIEFKNINQTTNYVYETTGPDYVTEMYLEFIKDNNLKNQIHILESKFGQQFGEYAKHNFLGTWKEPFLN
jgi:mannosyltransferase OCH1-like enzyme